VTVSTSPRKLHGWGKPRAGSICGITLSRGHEWRQRSWLWPRSQRGPDHGSLCPSNTRLAAVQWTS
jgi:hypothetical protein